MRLPARASAFRGAPARGGVLLSVHCDSPEWCDRAKKALQDTSARNVSSTPEAAAEFWTTDKPAERAPAAVLSRSDAPLQQTDLTASFWSKSVA